MSELKPNFISFFTGFGGFDLGLEQAGFECECQCEINTYALDVLQKNWPGVPKVKGIDNFFISSLYRSNLGVGGFPCQGISNAGLRKGLNDERSGLWHKFIRTVCRLGLDFVLVENVGAITKRGIDQILGDLWERGFDAEWSTVPASAFGYPYKRERVFFFGYAARLGLEGGYITASPGKEPAPPLDYRHDRVFISEPFGVRTTHGIPNYVERITGLGNAVPVGVGKFVGSRIIDVVRQYS